MFVYSTTLGSSSEETATPFIPLAPTNVASALHPCHFLYYVVLTLPPSQYTYRRLLKLASCSRVGLIVRRAVRAMAALASVHKCQVGYLLLYLYFISQQRKQEGHVQLGNTPLPSSRSEVFGCDSGSCCGADTLPLHIRDCVSP